MDAMIVDFDSDNFEDAIEHIMYLEHADEEIGLVLSGGVLVKSYEGTSQYSHQGISACGLASFNTVRCIMALEHRGVEGVDLINTILTRSMIEVSVLTHRVPFSR
jgi:hypothetical protein